MSADRFFVHDELLEEAVKMSMLPPETCRTHWVRKTMHE